MLDITLRPLKDQLFQPICNYVPLGISPLQVTGLAFVAGLASCFATTSGNVWLSTGLWFCNRALDCLDGAIARRRNQSSNLGGFLDLLGDFVVYSLIPIACGLSCAGQEGKVCHLWLSISVLEASFHINNFILFFAAGVLEKQKAIDSQKAKEHIKELTSVMMRPALIEGTESGVLFTLMLLRPAWTEIICWLMASLVCVGIAQRVIWLAPVL